MKSLNEWEIKVTIFVKQTMKQESSILSSNRKEHNI